MEVPITGVFILIMGTVLFFVSPNLLFAATIIAIPFSATAVANVSWGGSEKGVSAWIFFAALWIARDIVCGRPLWRRQGWFASRRSRCALLAFLAATVVSLCVPLILNGTAWLPDPTLASNETIPIRFSMFDVTQTVYLAAGVLFAVFAAAEASRSERLFYALRLYIASSLFASVWGLFELWCDVTGHTYPAYIFNNSATESAQGYQEALRLAEGAMGRVSSVALEPSILAQELLFALVVLLICLVLRQPLLGKKWDYCALILISVVLLASTSSTAYVGILTALLLAAATLAVAGKPWKCYFVLSGAIVGSVAVTAATVPLVGQVISVVLFNKFEEGSGLERLQSTGFAAQAFLQHPLFGAGWHNVPSADLVFQILANTGMLGFIAFGVFLLPLLWNLWQSTKKGKAATVVLLPAVILMVALSQISGLSYSTGHIWLVFGLGAGAGIAAQTDIASVRNGTSDISVNPIPHATTGQSIC